MIYAYVNEVSHHIPGFLSGISMYHVPLPVEFLVGAAGFDGPVSDGMVQFQTRSKPEPDHPELDHQLGLRFSKSLNLLNGFWMGLNLNPRFFFAVQIPISSSIQIHKYTAFKLYCMLAWKMDWAQKSVKKNVLLYSMWICVAWWHCMAAMFSIDFTIDSKINFIYLLPWCPPQLCHPNGTFFW